MLIQIGLVAQILARLAIFILWVHLPVSSLSLHEDNGVSIKILDVGRELLRESLPLKMGQRLYQLHGLKPFTWYEVKISYPASIPVSFSIQLKRNTTDIHFAKNRRLLNTEKLIFKTNFEILAYVLVGVDADGVVAKPNTREREMVIFNIVCDELPFGIPYKAWYVGVAALLCLAAATIIPYYLLSVFLLKDEFEEKELASFKTS